jgi:hypothetical protein
MLSKVVIQTVLYGQVEAQTALLNLDVGSGLVISCQRPTRLFFFQGLYKINR